MQKLENHRELQPKLHLNCPSGTSEEQRFTGGWTIAPFVPSSASPAAPAPRWALMCALRARPGAPRAAQDARGCSSACGRWPEPTAHRSRAAPPPARTRGWSCPCGTGRGHGPPATPARQPACAPRCPHKGAAPPPRPRSPPALPPLPRPGARPLPDGAADLVLQRAGLAALQPRHQGRQGPAGRGGAGEPPRRLPPLRLLLLGHGTRAALAALGLCRSARVSRLPPPPGGHHGRNPSRRYAAGWRARPAARRMAPGPRRPRAGSLRAPPPRSSTWPGPARPAPLLAPRPPCPPGRRVRRLGVPDTRAAPRRRRRRRRGGGRGRGRDWGRGRRAQPELGGGPSVSPGTPGAVGRGRGAPGAARRRQ